MPEILNLTTPKGRTYAPGVSKSVPALEPMGFCMHREPTFDPATGARTGWKAEGSFIEVTLVGSFGTVETVRVFEGQAALTAMTQLNTANLTTKSLLQRIMEAVIAYQEDGTTPYAGTLT